LKFEGGDPKSVPMPPELPNLQISDAGNARNFTIINGETSSSLSQTFALTPTQPGTFNIPALQAVVNGQTLVSQPLKLTAVKAAPPSSDKAGEQLAFLKLFVPRKEVYVGEVIAVELQVYIRDGVANAENVLQSFESFGGTPLKAEGFSIMKTAHAQRRRTRVGNSNFTLTTLVTSLSPVKTGTLSIGAMDIPPIPLQLPVSGQQRRRDPFDPFGMFQQLQERRVTLVVEPESLTALPLPKENVPANFNGAVGSFALAVTAGPTNVAMGDPITVKVQLTGRGAFDSLALPDQVAWHDFNSYPPTSKIDTTDALGLQGSKTFEQVIVPQKAEVKEIPPLTFSFFDPEQKNYRTLSSGAIPLIVRPSSSAAAPTISAVAGKRDDNPAPSQDIVHIKPRLGPVAQIAPPLVTQPWFLALQGLPLLAWLGARVWRKRIEAFANNPRLRRHRQVAGVIRDGLVELRQQAADNNSEGFFATMFRLLQEQLGERLDLPATAITAAVIEERLRPMGVAEQKLTPLRELFQMCDLARYAPIKSSQELAAIIPKIEGVLHSLQELAA
jgi:hypothetical protein